MALSVNYPASIYSGRGWPICSGIAGRFGPEWVADLDRNRRPVSIGISGRFAPEYAAQYPISGQACLIGMSCDDFTSAFPKKLNKALKHFAIVYCNRIAPKSRKVHLQKLSDTLVMRAVLRLIRPLPPILGRPKI